MPAAGAELSAAAAAGMAGGLRRSHSSNVQVKRLGLSLLVAGRLNTLQVIRVAGGGGGPQVPQVSHVSSVTLNSGPGPDLDTVRVAITRIVCEKDTATSLLQGCRQMNQELRRENQQLKQLISSISSECFIENDNAELETEKARLSPDGAEQKEWQWVGKGAGQGSGQGAGLPHLLQRTPSSQETEKSQCSQCSESLRSLRNCKDDISDTAAKDVLMLYLLKNILVK